MKKFIYIVAGLFCCSTLLFSQEMSGFCGTNLTWSYNENDQSLTIRGNGRMYNWNSYGDNAPWFDLNYTKVNIADGVTSIGDYAFTMGALTEVVIPNSVNVIGSYAFNKCGSLVSVVNAANVDSIGNNVFDNTPWLDNQPDGDVYFGKVYYAYKGMMPANTHIVIRPGTVCISDFAFSSINEEGYIQDNANLSSVSLPASLIYINNGAFQKCSALKDITIPENVKVIAYWAFEDCTSLRSIKVMAVNPPIVLDGAFVAVPLDAEVVVPVNSKKDYMKVKVWSNLINKERNGICGSEEICDDADNVKWKLTVDGTLQVYGKYNMTTYPWYKDYPWYKYCNFIKSVVISDKITIIGNGAFKDLPYLNTVIINAVNPPTIFDNPFENSKPVSFIIPESSRDKYMSDVLWNKILAK